jgi:hypothetical protein
VVPALVKAGGQVAAHQPEPVGIALDLVFGVDRRDRILKVDDRGQRGFEDDIGNPRFVGLAHRMVPVDDDFDAEAVVAQQDIVAAPDDRDRRIGQLQVAAVPIGPAAIGERHCPVEEFARIGDHRIAARAVIAAGAGGGRIEHVGAVKRVVKAAPARIGGVQHEPVVECGNDELRARHGRDFGVDILRADFEAGRFGNQIADFGQECLIGGHVGNRPRIGLVPGIELCLNVVALGEQSAVDGHEARPRMSARPAQSASACTPVPGSALASTKSASAVATCNPARFTYSDMAGSNKVMGPGESYYCWPRPSETLQIAKAESWIGYGKLLLLKAIIDVSRTPIC